ncbi:uncharacterized protein LOC134185996 [Corticium candelabrum]|uniref:uncharacterized protein LOC134185996 n=1 Tax=Corticium candelabrum TaxID=121492 RepID=UPI002E253569|nr:uncharacterized protein LOC134185996 [Corticium candelabrum]
MASTPPDVDLDSAGTEVSDFPLVAVPPSTPHSKLRESADVSTSDAFQLLDELLSEGKVGGDRVARLKAKYMELHSTLKTTRDHETALIQQAKEYTQQVAAQQAQLDKVDRILESGDTSEAIQLRRELLSHVNELSLSEDRYEKLMYDIYLLEEDRKEAEREYDRTLKPEDLEQKIQEINKAIEKLKDEISQRTQDSKQLLEAIEERQRLAGLAAKEMDEGLFKQVKLKDDFVQETTAAAAVAKELETLKLTKINVEDQKSRQEDLASQLDAQYPYWKRKLFLVVYVNTQPHPKPWQSLRTGLLIGRVHCRLRGKVLHFTGYTHTKKMMFSAFNVLMGNRLSWYVWYGRWEYFAMPKIYKYESFSFSVRPSKELHMIRVTFCMTGQCLFGHNPDAENFVADWDKMLARTLSFLF